MAFLSRKTSILAKGTLLDRSNHACPYNIRDPSHVLLRATKKSFRA
jgi:hypothetical protein